MDEKMATAIVENFNSKGSVFALHDLFWKWKAHCHLSEFEKTKHCVS